MKQKIKKEERVEVKAEFPVDTKRGRYYETCPRCDGHPIMRHSYVPKKPVRSENDFGEIVALAGGTLPIFLEDGANYSAACSCPIGNYRMRMMGLKRYDAIPGTSEADTKHSIVMAHLERMKK